MHVDFWTWMAFSAFLLLSAAALTVSHVRTWRRARALESEAKEVDYRRRQFRRRMQSTAMLALLAVALAVGYWVRLPRVTIPVFAIYWGGMLVGVCWVALLAVADMIATKHYFGRVHHHVLIEQAKLHAELRRVLAGRQNGKPASDPSKPASGSTSQDDPGAGVA